jgi:phosphatidylglycerophosphate synthase
VKPARWQVVIVGSCAGGAVLSYAQGLWDQQYAWWLALFLAMELGAAVSRVRGDTFSERLWIWIGVEPRRPGRWWRAVAVVVFLMELAVHFAAGSAHWWSGEFAVIATAVPVAVAIVTGALKWRVNRWV